MSSSLIYRLTATSFLFAATAAMAFAEAAGPGAGDPVAPAAPGAPAGAPGAAQSPSMLPTFLLMGGIVLFMYFVLIRPQRKEEAKRKEMLAGIKRGDQVSTIGGLQGVVETVGETTIDVRIGSGDKSLVVTFTKGAVNGNLSAQSNAADVKTAEKK